MRKAFTTYIRPLLEYNYNSPIWSPNLIYLIDLIESVQRKFSKRITSIFSYPYSIHLSKLNLQPLELRRLYFDLINYYKILNGLSSLKPNSYFLIYTPITSTRSITSSLQKPLRASSKLSSSFFYRSVDAWNQLPSGIKSLSSLQSFKSALKKVNLSSFLKFSFLV